ncbi:MAG: radical SAM protein, partial [Deltaproteobacteria bacterium]|nr:radical SAM protein [Deltaproteobacteria bacterium]
LTTNGFFLETMASPLKEAGLDRINISLDSLNPSKFQTITQTPAFTKVFNGFLKSLKVGFSCVKLNIVLMKGYNDDELFDFVALSQKYPICVRFIEFMPTRRTHIDQKKYFFSNQQALEEIQKRFAVMPEVQSFKTGPARLYRVKDALGQIGFISPMSHHFCDDCNRVRISAKGDLRLCLFSKQELNLLSLIRNDQWDVLETLFENQLQIKPLQHELNTGEVGNVESFISIGG